MLEGIYHWPVLPALPPQGRFVLICLRTGRPRAEARKEVRTLLRRLLASWTGLSPEMVPLQETPSGPVWQGEPHERLLDFSLSYIKDEAWVAVRRGGIIGLDAMRLEPVPEAEAMAQTYFDPADRAKLRESSDSVRGFALAWTQLEARCKCLKRGLTEWSEYVALETKACTTESLILQDSLALSIATIG